jgi:hypothetical protein
MELLLREQMKILKLLHYLLIVLILIAQITSTNTTMENTKGLGALT